MGSPGELRGRAWENMWEIAPAKRTKNTLTGVKGRGSRDTIHNFNVSVIGGTKVNATFGRASPQPEPRPLKQNASGFFSVEAFAQGLWQDHSSADLQNFHGLACRLVPRNQLLCTLLVETL